MHDDRMSRGFITVFRLLTVLMLLGGAAMIWIALQSTDAVNAAQLEMVAPNAKISQTIAYTRCGHEVVRRIDVFPGWVGKTKEGVIASLEKNWRMNSFAATLLEMTDTEDLFCPQHWVLMLGGDGTPGVYQNRFGFEMERVRDVSLGRFDEEARESLVRGMAFDSKEALEDFVAKWKDQQRINVG